MLKSEFQKRQLENHRDYYKRCLENLRMKKSTLEMQLRDLQIPRPLNSLSFTEELQERVYFSSMQCELDEVEAKIYTNEYHYQTYIDRVEAYEPIFEKESKEANDHFAEVFENAEFLASKHPESNIATLVAAYEKQRESQPDADCRQMLKNDVYIKFQRIIKQMTTRKPAPMKPVRG